MSSRIDELVSRMTWDEKLGQLQIVFRPNPDDAAALVRRGIGSTFWPPSAAATNALQRVAAEETRLGIPLLVGLDVIHGQRTIGPIPLSQAAAFDPGLVRELAHLAAREARSGGVTWTFSPMADVSRDPRWGRVSEGFGEDPLLTSLLVAAMVEGYQGDDLSAPDAIAATAKHFVGYGAGEGGRDYNGADLSERALRTVHLPPFDAAVRAGAASVMAAFTSVSGIPMHAHRRLLTDLLKGEWGFGGVVVGDAEGVANLVPHGVARDVPDAVRQSYHAGLDIEMGGAPLSLTADDLAPGRLDPARIDDAVRRVLRLKEALGLFENPYVDPAAEITAPDAASRALVRAAAARGSVLLQNDGVLPLVDPRSVLLTGPYATSTDHLGAWVQFFGAHAGTVADDLRARRPDLDLIVEEGADFLSLDDTGIAAAAEAARHVEIAVVLAGEPSALSGEAASRSDLALPGRQEDLIRAVAATGTPTVVMLVTGRPLVVAGWIDHVAAAVVVWHGGTEAPAAIVDLLLGEAEPAGRLPMSFPRSVGQVPIHYAHENTGRPATTGGTLTVEHHDVGLHGPGNVENKYTSKYLDLPLGPRFAFGHGSGYARFAHEAPRVSTSIFSAEGPRDETVLTVEIEVRNVSNRRGDEVVQVFARDVVATVTQPVRRLIGFARQTVDAGATATVTIPVRRECLALWRDGWVVEPGAFELHVGGSLDATQVVMIAAE
ncbi:glycoside hydrolase family 3 N-terminal domain-containing protein [Microbacterium enclense]|uniref:beta-glucosidase n=1 Tax=Microbacterium enclense TaxID=993073 RepID=A0A1G6INP3_9MICO|nr:glycoside hydrolase family 3 N-terminal domain-containing protein [Microbacterium enclense]SDC08094.1 beta-glucosidase [Microbacterium enclense]